MNRNVNSRFALNPTAIDISRSKFNRSSSLKTTFNVGDIVPIYVDEVLPGDTFSIKTSKVVRLQTLKTPLMDNMYLDTYYFFVPNRLVWEHWKEFNGESDQAWLPSVEYAVPQITAPSGGWNIGTIADYFGIPTGVDNLSVNALPFRSYALIMSEWFRDQNLQDPLDFPMDETTVAGVNTGTYVTDCAKGGLPYKASKYRDYFTSCLPAPQKGQDVLIKVTGGTFPVVGDGSAPLWEFWHGSNPPQLDGTARLMNGSALSSNPGWWIESGSTNVNGAPSLSKDPTESHMQVDLGNINVASVNQLREAFAVQKLYEKDARGGTRYVEILKNHFGVTSPDYRLQRPEYLGGNRLPININQIVQTSESNVTPQGYTTGMSLTNDSHFDFKKSFTEHGFVIGVCVVRYDHTYQQGLERMWSRSDRFDYYWPVFANLGEQAVLNKEIYAQGSSVVDSDGKIIDDKVFGYQEAWADYRYKPNRVTGEMRSSATLSLDIWHLGDDYASLPALSESWMLEDKSNVDRALAINSSVSNQVFADFYIENETVRPMPLYSIPGLIDHH